MDIPATLPLADAAWLAGYIDGDGCISMTYQSGPFRYPVLSIDSCDVEILEHVQSLLGGRTIPKTKASARHRQTWTWRVKGALRVVSAARLVYPHLRCAFKKERARMLIEEWAVVTQLGGHYSEDEIAAKRDFERRFMELGEGRGYRNLTSTAAARPFKRKVRTIDRESVRA